MLVAMMLQIDLTQNSEEKYDQLVQHIKSVNSLCHIFLCNSCPRGGISTTEVNGVVSSLAEQHQIKMIDVDKTFHDSRHNIIGRYYGSDCIHPSSSGVKRLLNVISSEIPVVQDYEKCVFSRVQKRSTWPNSNKVRRQDPHGSRRRNFRSQQENDNHHETSMRCYKCGGNNHNTSECRHRQQIRCYQCGFLGHKSGRCLQK